MHILFVSIHVKPEHLDAFVAATRDNAVNSLQEPGVLRFDVLQSKDEPTRFALYEVYKSPDDHAAHRETAHYLRWRDTVADMMAEPRSAVIYNNVEPGDAAWS